MLLRHYQKAQKKTELPRTLSRCRCPQNGKKTQKLETDGIRSQKEKKKKKKHESLEEQAAKEKVGSFKNMNTLAS